MHNYLGTCISALQLALAAAEIVFQEFYELGCLSDILLTTVPSLEATPGCLLDGSYIIMQVSNKCICDHHAIDLSKCQWVCLTCVVSMKI